MSERDLCNAIVDSLNYRGCLVWRENAGGMPIEGKTGRRFIRMAAGGTPDIIGMDSKGRFIGIEVKMPKRRSNVTELQQAFIMDIKRHGGIAGVATSIEEAWAIVCEQ